MNRVKDEDVKHLATNMVMFVNKYGFNNMHRACLHNRWPNIPYRETSIDLLTVKHLDHRTFAPENRVAVQMITELCGLIKIAVDACSKIGVNDAIFDFCETTLDSKDPGCMTGEMRTKLNSMRELAWKDSQEAGHDVKKVNHGASEYLALLQIWLMGSDPLMAKLSKE